MNKEHIFLNVLKKNKSNKMKNVNNKVSSIFSLVSLSAIIFIMLSVGSYALTIGNVNVEVINEKTARINWTTDGLSDSMVNYDKTSNLVFNKYSEEFTLRHSVVLDSLMPSTDYYFNVVSSDGVQTKTADNSGNLYSFRTLPLITFSDVVSKDVMIDSAVITWDTDIVTSGAVRYGETYDNLDEVSYGGAEGLSHVVKLENLKNGTTYYYRVFSNYAESETYEFVTRADDNIPEITGITIPEYYNKDVINIMGTTKPNSDVSCYIGGRLVRQGTSRSDGTFSFNYVPLNSDVTNILMKVVDQYGLTWEKDYTITIDRDAPTFKYTKIPETLQATTFKFEGSVSEPVTMLFKTNDRTEVYNITAEKFSEVLSFDEGENNVILSVTDRAGNKLEYTFKVYADTKAPVLTLDKEISAYSPSINSLIRLKGKVDEPGEVVITVNDRTYKAITGLNNTWEQVVELERKLEVGNIGASSTSADQRVELAPQYENSITIKAVDRSGRESTQKTGKVIYRLCGVSGDWDIVIGQPNPGALSPYDLKRGYGMFGFTIDLVWRGAGDSSNARITSTPVVRVFRDIGSAIRSEEYRTDLLKNNPVSSFLLNKGYVTVELKKAEDVDELEMLSFPLELDLQYTYNEFGTQVANRQRTCFTVDMLVDKTFDEGKIPEHFLESSVRFLNTTIEFLDSVIDPLKKVEKFVYFGCKAMQIRSIFDKANELSACYMFPNKIPVDNFGKAIAKASDCENVVGADKLGDAAISACSSCISAKVNSETANHEMALLCDRYTCPSVPTLGYYSTINEQSKAKKQVKTYYSPDSGFSLETNCGADILNKIAVDASDGRIDNKEQYVKCEKEYEFLWGPASLTQMNKIFEKSAKTYAEKNVDGFTASHQGLFDTISGVCAQKEAVKDTRTLYIAGREFIYDKETSNWSVTDEISVGTSNDKLEIIRTNKKEIVQYQNWFYYKYEPDTSKLLDDTYSTVDFQKNQLVLYSAKSHPPVETEFAVNAQGVPFEAVKATSGTFTYWRPNQKYLIKSGENPLQLDQLKQEFEKRDNEGKWLIESTDGLLSSLQSVCVPGIIQHIQNLKTISEQVKRCFQNLLITDEFSAGYCKAVLSEHVCDLVFDLIRCSFKLFDSKPRSDARIGAGAPGFFSALTSAGGEVSRDIKDRYGSTLTFDAMFNDRKVVHSICLGAFNHDWDINIDTILEENRQTAVPIKPDVFLYPSEIRYFGFNPLTGRVNARYHVGLGIVAGADMDYEVNLICSNDDSCSDSAGYPGGRCDCSYEGRGRKVKNIDRRKLSKGEINWGDDTSDLYWLDQDAPYRYDKVEIKWSYRNAKNEIVSDSIVKPITVDGPLPDEGCKLDIISGEFRCLFGFGEQGYAKFIGDVKPLQSIFQVGDSIKLSGRIDKYSPDDENNRLMVMKAKVYNKDGVLVSDDGSSILEWQLLDDKRYALETDFGDKGVPGYVIKLDDFKSYNSLVTGRVISNKPNSNFILTYPTPYSALVSGDIGNNNIVITLNSNTYEVTATGTDVQNPRGKIPLTGDLKLYVKNGVITLQNVKENMQGVEIITIEPPSQNVNDKFRVELSLYTTSDGGTPNTVPVDTRDVEITVRSSQSSSVCKSDGQLLRTECDCNGDGVKECGKSGSGAYCFIRTGKSIPSCNMYPVCSEGQVSPAFAPCDCNRDGELGAAMIYSGNNFYRISYTTSEGVNKIIDLRAQVSENDISSSGKPLFKDNNNNLFYYNSNNVKTDIPSNYITSSDSQDVFDYASLLPNNSPIPPLTYCEGTANQYCFSGKCYEKDSSYLPVIDYANLQSKIGLFKLDATDISFNKNDAVTIYVKTKNTDEVLVNIDSSATSDRMTRVIGSEGLFQYTWQTTSATVGTHFIIFKAKRGNLGKTYDYRINNIRLT